MLVAAVRYVHHVSLMMALNFFSYFLLSFFKENYYSGTEYLVLEWYLVPANVLFDEAY